MVARENPIAYINVIVMIYASDHSNVTHLGDFD